MAVTLRGRRLSATFDVTDVPLMRSYLGPDDKMAPFEAVVTIVDGDLTEIVVWGYIIGAAGKPLRKSTVTHYFPRDLAGVQTPPEGMDPADWEPIEIPEWLHTLHGQIEQGIV